MNLYCFEIGDKRVEVVQDSEQQARAHVAVVYGFIKEYLNNEMSSARLIMTLPVNELEPNRIVMNWLVARLDLKRPVRFLQIGGFDGVQGDPLHIYVRRYGWTGVIVEPLPWAFELLRTNYADVAGVELINAAVADKPGRAEMWFARAVDERDRWANQIGSFSWEYVEAALKGAGTYAPVKMESTRVNTMTLNDVLWGRDAAQIDVLCIDVEGYDLEVLRQVDWAMLKPKLVIWEEKALSDEGKAEARRMVEVQGYVTIAVGGDVYAARGLVVERELVGHPI